MSTIGDRIKAKREELGMTQDDLAQLTGYKSRSSINKIERGENDLPQTKITAFAIALKTNPYELLGWEDELPKAGLSFHRDPMEFLRLGLTYHFPQYSKDRILQILNILQSFEQFNDKGLEAVKHHMDELSQITEYLTEDEIQQRKEYWEDSLWREEQERKWYQEQLNPPNNQTGNK